MYLNGFKDIEDILHQYEAPAGALDEATVHYAIYTYEDYSGSSLVIFSIGPTLYEVNGSHCSCNGLEGQWSPEETSLDFLDLRFFGENADSYVFRDDEENRAALKHVLWSLGIEDELLQV